MQQVPATGDGEGQNSDHVVVKMVYVMKPGEEADTEGATGDDSGSAPTNLVDAYAGSSGVEGSSAQVSGADETAVRAEVEFKIFSSGQVLLDCAVEPKSTLPPLPRVGLRLRADKSLERAVWYGRGPHECYPDRKLSAHVAVHGSLVAGLHVPYIVPGECGARCDVRWLALMSGSNCSTSPDAEAVSQQQQQEQERGLVVQAAASRRGSDAGEDRAPVFHFSASRFSLEKLNRCQHDEELQPDDCVHVSESMIPSVLSVVDLLPHFTQIVATRRCEFMRSVPISHRPLAFFSGAP